MRIAGTVVVALLASTTSSVSEPRRDIAALGDVEGEHTRIIVRGELPQARRRALVSLVSLVVADVERRFTERGEPESPVTLLLFQRPARYREVARSLREPLISELGFYLPDRRIAIANVGNSTGNLRHELVHPLLGDDFPGIPAWLNEGIAALYGSSKPTKRGFQFLVNYRLRDLQRALRANRLPTLHQLATVSAAEFYGRQAMTYYALARYVLLYADREGRLGALYAELRAATSPADHARILAKHVDEDSFRAWARKLRF